MLGDNSAPMMGPQGPEELPPQAVTLMIPGKAMMRLEQFCSEAHTKPEDVIRFALAQFLAYQDGVAMLIVSGHQRAAHEAAERMREGPGEANKDA